jgi:hypothetical protein
MVTCACGKSIEKVPSWLDGVTVSFICNNCPNRNLRSIADVKAEELFPQAAKPKRDDLDFGEDLDENDKQEE